MQYFKATLTSFFIFGLLLSSWCSFAQSLSTSVPPNRCRTEADCPVSAKYCVLAADGLGSCRKKIDVGYAGCGVYANTNEVGGPCRAGSCSHNRQAGICVEANRLKAAYCSYGCELDSECGPNAFCGVLEGATQRTCIPYSCSCAATQVQTTQLDEVLALVAKDSCDLGQRWGDLEKVYPESIVHDPMRMTTWDRLYYAPMAIPPFKAQLESQLRSASNSAHTVQDLLRIAARLWDEPLPQETLKPHFKTLEETLLSFHPSLNEAEKIPLLTQIRLDAAVLPKAIQNEIASALAAIRLAIDLRNEAIVNSAELERLWHMSIQWYLPQPTKQFDKIDLAKKPDQALIYDVKYSLLAQAAIIIASAVDTLQGLPKPADSSFRFVHDTPFGKIIIGGTDDDNYPEDDLEISGPIAFFLELGGNDHYEIAVGANANVHNPVAIAVDLGGSDFYTYRKYPMANQPKTRPVPDAAGRSSSNLPQTLSYVARQGGANLGIAMLFDYGTDNDTYESLRFSQGAGVLGVGVLFDEGGNDTYHSEAIAQGGAHLGMGLLIDKAGNDRYMSYSLAQGGSWVKGVGMLVDFDGRDTYWTSPGSTYIALEDRNPEVFDYLYVGTTQGAAYGRRGDYPIDGMKNYVHSSGGVGALFDLGADGDIYTCGGFCQGTGYWFGTGIFYDDGGSDAYRARVFSGGSAVHFGLGIFHDGGGDDLHNVDSYTEYHSLAYSDDLSLVFFEEVSGNDQYDGGQVNSLSSAWEKGTAIMIEGNGDDVYFSRGHNGFGWASDPAKMHEPTNSRYPLRTHSVFFDGGGFDTYQRASYFTVDLIGNQRSWIHPHEVGDGPKPQNVIPADVIFREPNVYGLGMDK